MNAHLARLTEHDAYWLLGPESSLAADPVFDDADAFICPIPAHAGAEPLYTIAAVSRSQVHYLCIKDGEKVFLQRAAFKID